MENLPNLYPANDKDHCARPDEATACVHIKLGYELLNRIFDAGPPKRY